MAQLNPKAARPASQGTEIYNPTPHPLPPLSILSSSPISYLLAAALSLLTKSWSALIDHCGSFSLSSAGAPGCVLLEEAAEQLHTSITGQNGAGTYSHTHRVFV